MLLRCHCFTPIGNHGKIIPQVLSHARFFFTLRPGGIFAIVTFVFFVAIHPGVVRYCGRQNNTLFQVHRIALPKFMVVWVCWFFQVNGEKAKTTSTLKMRSPTSHNWYQMTLRALLHKGRDLLEKMNETILR